jgi:hypothetical protein
MTRTLLLALTFLALRTASAQPQGISIQLNVQHANCGNATGGISAWIWGGVPPYTLMWSPTPPSGQGSNSITGLAPGTYTLTVTDSQANEASATATVVLTPDLFPEIVAPTGWACAPGCSGGYYNYFPMNGSAAPYTVSFEPSGPVGSASPNGLSFNGLCIGESYTVTVTDNNGCSGQLTGLTVLGPLAPVILSQTITPSCAEGATGGFVIQFSEADSLLVNAAGVNGMLVGSVFSATNLAPGAYTIVVSAGTGGITNPPGGTSGPWCSATFVIQVPVTTDPCGAVSGMVYADLDADCAQAGDEPGIPHRMVSIEPGGHLVLTDSTGHYSTQLPYDDYALDANLPGYAVVCPTLPEAFTLSAAASSASIDVAMQPGFGPDAGAFLVMGVHRPGFPVTYTVSASNQGPFAFPGALLNLYFDPLLIVTNPAGGSLIAAGHLQWALGELAPFASTSFAPSFTVPANAALIGTAITGTAALGLSEPDSHPDNDSYTRTITIIGAYDPNDKLVATSTRASDAFYYLDADQWVDYTIRFQNTGTAEAINVHLTDTISPLLELHTLQLLGASHPFTAQLLPGRVLRFDFPGILLPDSASDLLGSQGFASFRLRPIGSLAAGDVLANNADIFFDFNEPVRTNTATLIAEFSTGVPERGHGSPIVVPNPVRDLLTISAPAGATRIEVLGADGRLVLAAALRDASLRIDAQRLAPGVYTVRCLNRDTPLGHGRFVKE